MKKLVAKIILVVCLVLGNQLFAQQQSSQHQKAQIISFSRQGNDVDITNGQWSTSNETGGVVLNLSNGKRSSNPFKKNTFFISFNLSDQEVNSLSQQANGFTLERNAGKLVCTGNFTGLNGSGNYIFEENRSFARFLSSEGIDGATSIDYLKLFLCDMDQKYITEIKKQGYQPTIKQLTKLGLLNISTDYVKQINATHYKGLELDMLMKFAIHGISKEYIDNLASAGYANLEPNMVKKWAIHGISSNYIKELNKAGYRNMEPNMIKKFAIHGISAKYIKGLNELGYKNLDPNVIKNFAIHGLSLKYIESLLKSNIDKPTTSELKKAAIHGVSAKFIEKAKNKGHDYDNLSAYTN